jgi:hypothetical protein
MATSSERHCFLGGEPMSFVQELKSQDFFPRLEHRKDTFALMVEHLDKFDGGRIIETGTLRIAGNYEGDGQSTAIWNWYLSKAGETWSADSVDISPEAVGVSREVCPLVRVHESDSLKFLSSQDDLSDLRLLYLDSFDWHPDIALDSAFHHMAELATVWAKLPEGCMIVVDDRHGPMAGKHFMVEFFMEKLNREPVFKQYQIGWIK